MKCLYNSYLVSSAICVLFAAFVNAKVLKGEGGQGDECEIENGVMGRCETFFACQSTGGTVKRNGTMRMCSPSGGQELFCCRRPFEIAKQVCEAWKSYWKDNDGKCIFKTPMIVGGEEANVGQFPEIGILGIGKNLKRIRWICGGSLISPYFVLTAAHCVLEKNQYALRFGDHDLYEMEGETLSRVIGPVPLGLFKEKDLRLESRNTATVEQLVLVSDIYIYPEYDGRYHDIALLRLDRPVVFTKRVLPVCLPTDPIEDYLDYNLTVAGWGRIQYGSSKLSPTLQKVNIPVIERLKCWEDLKELNEYLIPKGITEQQICAGEPGKDSCKGDSGGPLLLQVKEKSSDIPCEHTIAGIVSFGSGCGRFGVYTRVSSYIEWITEYIAPGVVPLITAPGVVPLITAPGVVPLITAPGVVPLITAPGVVPVITAPGVVPLITIKEKGIPILFPE